jgi:transcriptional regulator with XRE-family HTH domain
MLNIMPATPLPLYPSSARELAALGERLKNARLRRRFSARTVSARANISRTTLSKIEHGDPAVTLGNYVQVLRVLGLEKDLTNIAKDDELGRRLQDERLPHRLRAPRRPRSPAGSDI